MTLSWNFQLEQLHSLKVQNSNYVFRESYDEREKIEGKIKVIIVNIQF